MTTRTKRRGILARALDRAIDALSSKDEKAMKAALDELKEIEEETEDELPAAGDPPMGGTGDSMPMWAVQLRDSVAKIGRAVRSLDEGFAELSEKVEKKADDEFPPRKKEGEEAADGVGTGNENNEKILGQLEMEAPPGTGDAIRRATDSVMLSDAFKDVVAKAEIIAPGITLPSFDAKAKPAKTFDAICGLRRTALDLGNGNPQVRGAIDAVTGGRGINTKTATCDAVRSTFNAVAAMRSTDNNKSTARDVVSIGGGQPVARGKILSIADLNKTADERYGKKRA